MYVQVQEGGGGNAVRVGSIQLRKIAKNCGPQCPLCDSPSGCCFFTGLWTVTRSSLRVLRPVVNSACDAECGPTAADKPPPNAPCRGPPTDAGLAARDLRLSIASFAGPLAGGRPDGGARLAPVPAAVAVAPHFTAAVRLGEARPLS